jgi:hypothetical protein
MSQPQLSPSDVRKCGAQHACAFAASEADRAMSVLSWTGLDIGRDVREVLAQQCRALLPLRLTV